MTFEVEQRAQAKQKFEAGEFRAALHIWDTLEHPEVMDDAEIAMFEAARRKVQGPA